MDQAVAHCYDLGLGDFRRFQLGGSRDFGGSFANDLDLFHYGEKCNAGMSLCDLESFFCGINPMLTADAIISVHTEAGLRRAPDPGSSCSVHRGF